MKIEKLIKIVSSEHSNIEDENVFGLARNIMESSQKLESDQVDILLNGLPISGEIDAECDMAGGWRSIYDSCVLRYALNYAINGVRGFDVGFKYAQLTNGKKFAEKMGLKKIIEMQSHEIWYSSKFKMFFCPQLDRYDFSKDGTTGGGYSSLIFKDYQEGKKFVISMLRNSDVLSYVKDIDLIHNNLSMFNYDKVYATLGYKMFDLL